MPYNRPVYCRKQGRMTRTFQSDFTVIKTSRIGEFHKGIQILTPDYGIISCIAHGVYKGRNRMGTATDPFCTARGFFYKIPASGEVTLKDAVLTDAFELIRTDLKKLYQAAMVAETTRISHAAGGAFREMYDLVILTYSLLNSKPVSMTRNIGIQYLLRLLFMLGVLHELHSCSSCGHIFPDGDGAAISLNGNEPLCGRCLQEGDINLTRGEVKFINASLVCSLDRAIRIGLDAKAMKNIFMVLLAMTERVLETRIQSFRKDFA